MTEVKQFLLVFSLVEKNHTVPQEDTTVPDANETLATNFQPVDRIIQQKDGDYLACGCIS